MWRPFAALLLWLGFRTRPGLVARLFYQHRRTGNDVKADGFLTAGSIVGTVLLGRKYIENWPLWLIVNVVSIALFVYKQLPLTAILYGLFLALALWGWRVWWHKLAAHKIAGNT